ncbi:hypothetical protein K8I28_03955 [bacterium]|nr:hypothetical protein [bacterium]
MKRKWLVGIVAVIFPLILFASVWEVGVDTQSVNEAIFYAQDGDTILIPESMSSQSYDLQGKDLTLGITALEPEDAEPDSTIYGPNNPFPASPVE